MNYKQLAKDILQNVGGMENVSGLTHCATRLRFNLKDSSKAQTEQIKKIKGVMGVINKGGQYQVVIGSDVANVYREINDLSSFDNSASDSEADNKGPVVKVLDTIAGIFTPIIPAITGAGMLKAVMALLVTFKLIATNTQTYAVLSVMADAAFFFLPFLIANSAAIKFKVNPYMAMSIAGVILHPNFISMVAAAKKAGQTISFIGLPVSLASYSSSVIPIILAVWLMSFVEPFADKVSPKPVKFFTKPLLTLLVTAPLTLIVIGPLGIIIGNGISSGIAFLNSYASWLVPLIVGTFSPLLVMTGTHYGLIPIGINNIATAGFDTVVGPGMLGSNIAQGGAALAVAIKSKNKDLKQLASSAGLTAVCGITEPAMYGVNLKLKKPLIAAMIGGGISGLFLGITGVGRYTSGSPGLLALPGYIGTSGLRNITFAIIGSAIAFVVAFAATWIMGFEDIPATADSSKSKEAAADKA
jgi:beta-glucoside PTS system EIICBA component